METETLVTSQECQANDIRKARKQQEAPETVIIKRYQNRKLYDTFQSTYVTLEELRAIVKTGQNIQVIDNKTKSDITNLTLLQIVFETEKKKLLSNDINAMTLDGLNQVIRNS